MTTLRGSTCLACSSPVVLVMAVAALFPRAASADGARPREIIIEPETLTKPPPKYTPMEQRAVDNALTAGAVETLPPVRHRSQEGRLEKDISVEGGRCYYVSVVTNTGARISIVYVFGQTADGRSISERGNIGKFLSPSGGQGVARFCVDRSGTVHLNVGAELVDTEQEVHYAMVVGSRPETPEQMDARHRLASTHDESLQN